MPEVSDLSFPNFSKLYHEALASLHREGLVEFSTLESVTLGVICSSAETGPDQASLGDRVVYEIDHCDLPKWVALVSWLNPMGPCAQDPTLFGRIANYLLGYTRREEESAIPQFLREELGV